MRELTHKKEPYVLIITGPTASGKTDLSLKISRSFKVEIINIDVGQFYKPLSIGTAKPNWNNQIIVHHCFDILEEPKDLSSYEFNKIVLNEINDVLNRGNIPVLVGGSLFYIKSLFFPPKELSKMKIVKKEPLNLNTEQLWEKLNVIDNKRAGEIGKNDIYRIKRALEIWQTTGIKPSEYKPEFISKFNARILFLNVDKKVLKDRINKRTLLMIKNGWIKEAKDLQGTKWESFLEVKKLIGYMQIFKWLKGDKKKLNELIKTIQTKTWQYAKRQLTFWKSFENLLEKNKKQGQKRVEVSILNDLSEKTIEKIKLKIQGDIKHIIKY